MRIVFIATLHFSDKSTPLVAVANTEREALRAIGSDASVDWTSLLDGKPHYVSENVTIQAARWSGTD